MSTVNDKIDPLILDIIALKHGWIEKGAFFAAHRILLGQPVSVNPRGKLLEVVAGRGATPVRVPKDLSALKEEWRKQRFAFSHAASITVADDPCIAGVLLRSRWVAHGHAMYKSIKMVRPDYHRVIYTAGGASVSSNGIESVIDEIPLTGVVVIHDQSLDNAQSFATVITRSRT